MHFMFLLLYLTWNLTYTAAGVEQKFYRSDPDCIAAGKPLVQFELYQSTVLPLEDKGVR